MGWGKFKPLLADALVEALKPIQTKYATIIENQSELKQLLFDGQAKAENIANQTLVRLRAAMGFLDLN
jgi:tryptophanyl-tRNA synthetase